MCRQITTLKSYDRNFWTCQSRRAINHYFQSKYDRSGKHFKVNEINIFGVGAGNVSHPFKDGDVPYAEGMLLIQGYECLMSEAAEVVMIENILHMPLSVEEKHLISI